jgi:hypothetical protein
LGTAAVVVTAAAAGAEIHGVQVPCCLAGAAGAALQAAATADCTACAGGECALSHSAEQQHCSPAAGAMSGNWHRSSCFKPWSSQDFQAAVRCPGFSGSAFQPTTSCSSLVHRYATAVADGQFCSTSSHMRLLECPVHATPSSSTCRSQQDTQQTQARHGGTSSMQLRRHAAFLNAGCPPPQQLSCGTSSCSCWPAHLAFPLCPSPVSAECIQCRM